jgi:hypothetical protein
LRKEIAVGLTFLLLLALSLVNIAALSRLTEDVSALTDRCADAALSGDWVAATSLAQDAADRWRDSEGYTHLVLRHGTIEAADDALGELVREALTHSVGGVAGAARTARAHMESLSRIEHIRLGSVFYVSNSRLISDINEFMSLNWR